MKPLSADIINFLQGQEFVIVSTLDSQGKIHCAAKGIVDIDSRGKIYLIDLYQAHTYTNLQKDPRISITAVNGHQFIGYTLKGRAKISQRAKIGRDMVEEWQKRVVQRISQRVIRDVRADKKSPHHPEAKFPLPEYLIEVEVEDIVDLTPRHLKYR
ncbi:MAG: pyridoxamine 5'-phosphate oxidase family protein [Candidatus Omnitrophota bacterium]|nr:MAG: pyridoxamine 5'-phosphate oxidase family protein [Candidatus Omnitrophota bacterium]